MEPRQHTLDRSRLPAERCPDKAQFCTLRFSGFFKLLELTGDLLDQLNAINQEKREKLERIRNLAEKNITFG